MAEEIQSDIRELERRIEDLRKQINAYRKERARTDKLALRGSKKYTPAQALALVRSSRDPSAERKMLDDLRTLNKLLLGREPTEAELAVGLPSQKALSGLGVVWLIPAIVGGAFTLTSAFAAWREHERTLQRQIDPGAVFWEDLLQWTIPAGIAVAATVGAYWGYKQLSGKVKQVRRKARRKEARRNPEHETKLPVEFCVDEEDEKDDDSCE